MRRGSGHIPRRKRIFLGCEGEGEQGYLALVQSFCDAKGLPVHLDIHLCRAGDPLAIVEVAIQKAAYAERRGRYALRAVLLDADKLGAKPDRDTRIRSGAPGRYATLTTCRLRRRTSRPLSQTPLARRLCADVAGLHFRAIASRSEMPPSFTVLIFPAIDADILHGILNSKQANLALGRRNLSR